ncbi:antitoxin MazE [Methylobacterium sp. 174MFSha1.1]|uniref:AbrB/MazE/SpoVT family DNA-binding domain-containing protein n=1 Tax=Methylobacterium sp. 174MFSha1.1 TaxID=1502749 RepID=UPI0008EA6957|nr:AbrB/MazE/SpoVT family DNA-binding domain-containing protein [Methylobacterium sp. 174MFSha1.1]SFV03822.1 antitoxin MazE [Methylobacterium sp. 174MFSha1.1]
MRVQFARWGNSVAVRIPSQALRELGATEGMSADLSVESGKIVVTPIGSKPRYTLEELMATFKDEHVHEEHFADRPRGEELP